MRMDTTQPLEWQEWQEWQGWQQHAGSDLWRKKLICFLYASLNGRKVLSRQTNLLIMITIYTTGTCRCQIENGPFSMGESILHFYGTYMIWTPAIQYGAPGTYSMLGSIFFNRIWTPESIFLGSIFHGVHILYDTRSFSEN